MDSSPEDIPSTQSSSAQSTINDGSAEEDLSPYWRRKASEAANGPRRRSERLKKPSGRSKLLCLVDTRRPSKPALGRPRGPRKPKPRMKVKKSRLTRRKQSSRSTRSSLEERNQKRAEKAAKVDALLQRLQDENPLDEMSVEFKKRLACHFALRGVYVLNQSRWDSESMVAELFDCTRKSVREWVKEFELPHNTEGSPRAAATKDYESGASKESVVDPGVHHQ
ncbi:hypothetical protein FOL47_008236 [Perkinsus chesapeaki]|uniref:Uncharacterized protein n=1 Tax=Perkinsus chesapeaki TaxID=330153 RepID=A0A7J6LFB0_PERCH|nr:hypothetical protein FOL47_008236 [Perkinsus chesapeaki]